MLWPPAELPGIAVALEVVFSSLEELKVVCKRLLALLWTTFEPSFWAEGVAGIDSDARRLLYLRQQNSRLIPRHHSHSERHITIKWAILHLQPGH